MTAKSWSSNHDPSSFNRPFVLPDRPVFCACPWRLHGRPRSSVSTVPGSKFINGVEVWRECGNYQTTRHCTSSSIPYLLFRLKQTPGCRQTTAECLSYSLTGTCMVLEQYLCLFRRSQRHREHRNPRCFSYRHLRNRYFRLFKFLRQSRLLYRRRKMCRRP